MEIIVSNQRKSDECGCPEEDLEIGMCTFLAHLEPDGSAHLFLDMGDWDDEKVVECDGVEGMRQKAHDWAEQIHEGIVE